MKVKKSQIPAESLVNNFLPTDHTDVYECALNYEHDIDPDDIMVRFWTDMPGWINALFKLRNFLVRFVGLKTEEKGSKEELEKCIRTGGSYNFVSVAAKNSNETVLLLEDQHLNAYISICVRDMQGSKKIAVITLVKFNNRLGRIYFFLIKPFHGLVVKGALRRSVKNLPAL